MKICLQCTAQLEEKEWSCPACGWAPIYQDGFPLLSPELADGFADYPVNAHNRRVHLEASNFWFVYRNQVIACFLGLFFSRAKKLLEIGCGTGFVLSGISHAFPSIELLGVEAYPSALKYARERVRKAEFAQMDACRLPFVEEFDVVGAFDVLEHMSDDNLALKEIYKATNRGGGLIMTVPQHPWLWSTSDDRAGHKRRYTRRELKHKVQSAGFDILHMTSFISLLLPLMMMSRWKKSRLYKSSPSDTQCEIDLPKPINILFKLICSGEFLMVRNGFSLPVGGSLLCIARKKRS